MRVRPPSLAICGITMLVFGMVALMNLLPGMGQAMTLDSQAPDNPLVVALRQSQGMREFRQMLFWPQVLIGLLGIVAGIGVVKGSDGARKAGILWAVLYFFIGATENGATVFYVREAVQTLKAPPAWVVEEFRQRLMAPTLVNVGFTTVFFLAVAIAIIVLLTRRGVVRYCSAKPVWD